MLNPDTGRNTTWHRLLRGIADLRWEGLLRVRHLRYTGLWLEAIGIAAIAASGIGLTLAVLCFPYFLLAAAVLEEDWAIREWRARAHEDWPYSDSRQPIMFQWRLVGIAFAASSIVALVVGFWTRELEIIKPDPQTAQTLLLSIAGAQLTFLLFVISGLLIGLQFLSTNYSWTVVDRLLRHYWLVALSGCLLVLSALADVFLVGNTGPILGHERWAATVVELSLSAALAAAALLILSVSSLRRMLAPDGIVRTLLGGLRSNWLQVRETRTGDVRLVVTDNGPIIAAMSVLQRLIAEGNILSFPPCFANLSRSLLRIWPAGDNPQWVKGYGGINPPDGTPETWPDTKSIAATRGIDAYMAFLLRPLMRSALSAGDPEFGEAIFGLARDLYDRGHPYAFGNRTSSLISGEEPGEAILRDIVKESIRLKMPSIAARALTTMMFACERLLPALPPRSATSFEKDRDDSVTEYTEEERLLQRAADEKHQVILWNYLNYLVASLDCCKSWRVAPRVDAILRRQSRSGMVVLALKPEVLQFPAIEVG